MMESADLGFDGGKVMTTSAILTTDELESQREAIKAAFLRTPGVEGVTTLWPGPGATGKRIHMREVRLGDLTREEVEAKVNTAAATVYGGSREFTEHALRRIFLGEEE